MVFSASWQLSENAPQPEEERDRAEAGGEKAAAGVAAARTASAPASPARSCT